MIQILFLLLPFLLFSNDSAVLRVGMELSYPPFETVCENGEPCGISVDLAKALGEAIHQKILIENIPFIGLIPSLQNGTVDLVISSLTVTEERKKAIDFSDPYATTGLCLLLNRFSAIQDVQELNQDTCIVVVKSGTSGEIYARNHLQNAIIRVFDKESACVLEVIQDKAEAFIYDQLSVYTQWKKHPDHTKANLHPFQKEQWAFGIRKNNPELLKQINQFLKEFRAKKRFDALAEKYLPEQKRAFEKMGVPFVF